MGKDDQKIEEARQNNTYVFMKNGPGLRYDYQTWIVARDRKRNRVLVGGLGGMGVGEMWSPESDRDKEKSGYEDAPEQDSWMGFGTKEQSEASAEEYKKMLDRADSAFSCGTGCDQ